MAKHTHGFAGEWPYDEMRRLCRSGSTKRTRAREELLEATKALLEQTELLARVYQFTRGDDEVTAEILQRAAAAIKKAEGSKAGDPPEPQEVGKDK